jgi:hypothetical protein
LDIDIHIHIVNDASNEDALDRIFLPEVRVRGLYDIK